VPAIFVDTSAFYAVADESDRHHIAAREVFLRRGEAGELATSDHVFVESWCLIRARLGRGAAMRYWDAMETGIVQVLGVCSEDVVHGRDIARDWSDQDFSLVDCTSFAVMEGRGIEEVLAFDVHFRIYRYGEGRWRAFRVVP
jgi:predicted nucleic acid-binding protein